MVKENSDEKLEMMQSAIIEAENFLEMHNELLECSRDRITGIYRDAGMEKFHEQIAFLQPLSMSASTIYKIAAFRTFFLEVKFNVFRRTTELHQSWFDWFAAYNKSSGRYKILREDSILSKQVVKIQYDNKPYIRVHLSPNQNSPTVRFEYDVIEEWVREFDIKL